MRVVEIETQDHQRRYVVIDDEGSLIEPIMQYLKYLDHIGAARNTLRSYATALRLYWQHLIQQELDWQQVTLDHLAQFVVWLKLPSGSFKVLPAQPVSQARSNRTINQTLMVVRGFYDYHWRMEDTPINVKDKTTTYLPAHARCYKSFLHHISKGSPLTKNILRQKEEKQHQPKTLTKDQVQKLLDACSNQRDRLLVRLLYESAMRIGEGLALFVEDVDVAENCLHICDRGDLSNEAEIKTIHAPRTIPVSSERDFRHRRGFSLFHWDESA
jgi:site-specific recombinase XerD